MKKILAALVCFLCAGAFLCAENNEWRPVTSESNLTGQQFEELKTQTKVIQYTTEEVKEIVLKGSTNEKETSSFDDTCNVKIEYQPTYDEVRIYYECSYITYDQGQAMNVLMAVLLNFQKEYKYTGYDQLRPDKDKFFREDDGRRKAQYVRTLKFKRK